MKQTRSMYITFELRIKDIFIDCQTEDLNALRKMTSVKMTYPDLKLLIEIKLYIIFQETGDEGMALKELDKIAIVYLYVGKNDNSYKYHCFVLVCKKGLYGEDYPLVY